MLSVLYVSLGRQADVLAAARESLARCQRQLEAKPESALAAYTGALALANLGERERALEWSRRALAIEPDDHMTLYNVACVYAELGLFDDAVDLLERAMPGASAHRQEWLRQDPDLRPLRDHPRFVALLRRLTAG
jgi:adenylate cyclase